MSSENTTNYRLPFILLDAFQLVTNNFGDLRLTCIIRRILDQFHAWYCLSNDTKFPTNRYNWYRHEVHEVKCLQIRFSNISRGNLLLSPANIRIFILIETVTCHQFFSRQFRLHMKTFTFDQRTNFLFAVVFPIVRRCPLRQWFLHLHGLAGPDARIACRNHVLEPLYCYHDFYRNTISR